VAVAAAAVAAGVGACLAATGAGAGRGAPAPGTGDVPAAWLVCAADADCVRAPADCCGCPGGGGDVAIAAPFADAWAGRIGARCAAPGACPEKRAVDACAGGVVCRSGSCALE